MFGSKVAGPQNDRIRDQSALIDSSGSAEMSLWENFQIVSEMCVFNCYLPIGCCFLLLDSNYGFSDLIELFFFQKPIKI